MSREGTKRILVVCQHFWPENFRINDIVDYFTEDDIEVDVLCGRPNYPAGKLFDGYTLWNKRREKYKKATIYRVLEIPRGNNSNARIFLNYLSFPFFSLFHIPRMLTKRYDKIFLYQLSPVMMSIAGILIGKIKRIETIMYVLDLWPENLFSVLDIKNHFLRKLVTRISHWYYRRVDRFIVLSQSMKDRILSITKRSSDDIAIIPQAAEQLYEQPLYDKFLEERFKETFNIVFTGNISPAQSLDTMIQAASTLKDRGRHDIRWVIVGDGMSMQDTINKAKSKNLSDIFIFEGRKPIEDMPKYMNIADALVGCLVKSNLLEATIPAKVMSYIAAGKPIVLAMDGEVQQLINQTIKCGFAGPTEDAEQLANNIDALYSLSEKQRHKLGDNARKYHHNHFERNYLLKKMLSFILDKESGHA